MGDLGPTLGPSSAILSQSWAIFGGLGLNFGELGAILNDPGPILGPSSEIFRKSKAIFSDLVPILAWANVERSWVHVAGLGQASILSNVLSDLFSTP
ncbi:MAG: hypothetical protein VX107_01895 [Pseudomonadota bacterium]|nr:hypothetical protein [Pseudomonadota bacterium]